MLIRVRSVFRAKPGPGSTSYQVVYGSRGGVGRLKDLGGCGGKGRGKGLLPSFRDHQSCVWVVFIVTSTENQLEMEINL